ncbi:class I SAM-dependent methyltransferase [Mucilaginibacter koreensis]
MINPTQRFSDRVEDYIKYRPGYPAEAINYILNQSQVQQGAAVADIGSGTGISSKLFLERGYQVYGIEPNEPMRKGAEGYLKEQAGFISVNGSSEHTTLPDGSVDLVVAGTAFHWFKQQETKAEFQRILKPGGYVALFWNVRKPDADEFNVAYEQLLKQQPEYRDTKETYDSYKDLQSFFGPEGFEKKIFAHEQHFDADGLAGRSRSSSFVPQPGTDEGFAFFQQLTNIFSLYQVNGQVTFYYDAVVYMGKM